MNEKFSSEDLLFFILISIFSLKKSEKLYIVKRYKLVEWWFIKNSVPYHIDKDVLYHDLEPMPIDSLLSYHDPKVKSVLHNLMLTLEYYDTPSFMLKKLDNYICTV